MSTLNATNIKNPSSGSNNIVLAADGSTTIPTLSATTITGAITRGTAVASTSGTSVEFTGIPSWAKKVTLMLQGVSTNGTSPVIAQLGTSGGYNTSDYKGTIGFAVNGGIAASIFSSSFVFEFAGYVASTETLHGLLTVANINSNAWVANGVISRGDSASICTITGSISLAGVFDRIRITTVAGTNTFDAGTVNIMYEG
jgi:hypothetical protein